MTETQRIIHRQQRVAKMLLTDITAWTSKPAVVAGGALLDWETSHYARDIDIYMESDPNVSNERFMVMLGWMLEDQGYEVMGRIVQLTPETNNPYEESYIEGVFEFAVKAGPEAFDYENIQIIRLKPHMPAQEVMQEFVLSTSQAMMLPNGHVMYSSAFFNSIGKNVALFRACTSDAYLAKTVRKLAKRGFTFREWPYESKTNLDDLPF